MKMNRYIRQIPFPIEIKWRHLSLSLILLIQFNLFAETGVQSGEQVPEAAPLPDSCTIFDVVKYDDSASLSEIISRNLTCLDSTDKRGYTALHNVIVSGNLTAAEFLVKAGASTEITADNDRHETPLIMAINRSDSLAVSTLIELDADINRLLPQWGTPLHIAAGNCNTPILSLLLENYADLLIIDKNGDTPLHLAIMRDCEEAVEQLLNAGADCYAVNLL